MKITTVKKVLKFSVTFKLNTDLLIRSGKAGEYFTDSAIEKTPDQKKLHINGYVWASLMRRALNRVKDAEKMAKNIGKYEDASKIGVSPFWCESSFVELEPTDVRTGNKVSRKWGATASGALFSDELVPPGYDIILNFNYFCDESEELIRNRILSALWVVDQGIETIGGGWSYGYGRLEVCHVKMKQLDLKNEKHRNILWQYDDNITGWDIDSIWLMLEPPVEPEIIENKRWTTINVSAKIPDGQLLAISTATPPLDLEAYDKKLPDDKKEKLSDDKKEKLPDSYVFRRYRMDNQENKQEIVITGKAIRQALLSVPIERKLRTICDTPGEKCTCATCSNFRKNNPGKEKLLCSCKRCEWFGSTDQRGIISVSDAVVRKEKIQVIHRIQLCEHSMQNMNLFAGEYLKQGSFSFEIIVDYSESERSEELIKCLIKLLCEMCKDGECCEVCKNSKTPPAPRGWYRIGATSTCTGQIEITDIKVGDAR